MCLYTPAARWRRRGQVALSFLPPHFCGPLLLTSDGRVAGIRCATSGAPTARGGPATRLGASPEVTTLVAETQRLPRRACGTHSDGGDGVQYVADFVNSNGFTSYCSAGAPLFTPSVRPAEQQGRPRRALSDRPRAALTCRYERWTQRAHLFLTHVPLTHGPLPRAPGQARRSLKSKLGERRP